MGVISYAGAIRAALAQEMDRDDRVFVMGQDVGVMGGVFAATKGLFDRFGPERVVDSPISENFLVGGGVGAALNGMRPVVELQYADFIAIAMDELLNKAAKWRYMHGGLQTVPLVVRAPSGAVGGAGPEHSQCPEALLWGAAGLHVVLPSTPADMKGLLAAAIRSDDPVVVLEHKALYGMRGEVPDGEHVVPLGRAAVVREGTDVTVVAWQALVHRALGAAETLEREGVSVEVVDPRGIRPLDLAAILASVERTGRLVLAHEASLPAGPTGEVAALVAERGLDLLLAPIRRVGAHDSPMPQNAELEKLAVPGAAAVADAVRAVMAHR